MPFLRLRCVVSASGFRPWRECPNTWGSSAPFGHGTSIEKGAQGYDERRRDVAVGRMGEESWEGGMDNGLGGIEASSRIRAGEMLANCGSAKELKTYAKIE